MSLTCRRRCGSSKNRMRFRDPVDFDDAPAASSNTDLEELERDTIQRVFEQVHGDKARARKMLGISRATLYRKLKRYNIGLQQGASASS